MKRINSVLTCASVNGNRIRVFPAFFMLLALVPSFFSGMMNAAVNSTANQTVDGIYLKFHNRIEDSRTSKFRALLQLKNGDKFSYKAARKSMENLYKAELFENIEIRIRQKPGQKTEVFFVLTPKYMVNSIRVSGKTHVKGQTGVPASFKRKELGQAVFSIREGDYFDETRLKEVTKEVRQFLHSRGHFNPQVSYKISRNHKRFYVNLKIIVKPRQKTIIKKVDIKVKPVLLRAGLQKIFKVGIYIPLKFKERIEKARTYLKKQGYYFPEIKLTEKFSSSKKDVIKLDILVLPGYKYQFEFLGMKNKINLISTIWGKKVFEKWAEKESKSRILYYLKNKGFLNATIESRITVEEATRTKTITFEVKKNAKYKLGKIYLSGNVSIKEAELRRVIKTGELLFNKFFHLRLQSLLVDREILRLFYYFQGFPNAKVRTQLGPGETGKSKNNSKGKQKTDVTFVIEEGKRYTVDSVLFKGNRFFTGQTLNTYMQTRANGPFVQQRLNEDLEKIRNLYLFYGFNSINIDATISEGQEKSIFVTITENPSFRMGNLIVIGASKQQRKLIAKLFPLKKDKPFNRLKIDEFERDIENSGIFSLFKITQIKRLPDVMDVLIKVKADYGKYYGFGFGWVGQSRLRGTLEYQGRNVLRSYSTLSGMMQLGNYERRGVLSYDTPYFFKTRINSSLKLWIDNEVYPSFEFNRYGIGESLVKKLTPDSYILASLSWYQTKLTSLEVPSEGIDQKDLPFNTVALNFSYVQEKRDDPFNPTSGSFFSSDLKIGSSSFLASDLKEEYADLEKRHSFVKFHWSYQQNFKFLNNGVLAVSVRNGLATDGLSITERFFAGGSNTYRGTHRDQLGPSIVVDNQTKPFGGSALVLFNFETTFPLEIIPVSDFYYSIFVDVGDVFTRVHDFKLVHLETAVGIGLKYKTRMGPLRFDFAWDTGKRFSWKNFKFHIGIGNVF